MTLSAFGHSDQAIPRGPLLGIVPARMGSKGIPRKNLQHLGGIPLVSWSLRFACLNGLDVVVSTDSEETAQVARQECARAPFLRSPHLSGDQTPSVDVVIDCLDFVEYVEGTRYEYVVMLEPTSPFRRASLLRDAMSLLTDGTADAAVSVMPAGNGHPNFAMKPLNSSLIGFDTPFGGSMTKRRQDCSEIYFPEGSIYISTVASLRERGTFYHSRTALIEVGPIESIDIDTPQDLTFAETILAGLKAINESEGSTDMGLSGGLGWLARATNFVSGHCESHGSANHLR